MIPALAKYSIMLPVKNGGAYVKECVHSILAQTFSDFNLIILDNNSNDGTLQWIQSLKDSRIIIYPSTISLLIEQNWGRIKDVEKGEFITLIGHDDILKPDYLSVMDALIKKYPDASLYQTHFDLIDSSGATIRTSRKMENVQYVDRFLKYILNNEIDIMGTGFMMRSRDYDAIGGFPAYPYFLYCDIELWIRLTQISYLAVSEKNCFAFRLHQSSTTSSSDKALQVSFGYFISFFVELKNTDEKLAKVIDDNVIVLLEFYTKSLAHRSLRKPIKEREGRTVRVLVNEIKLLAEKLGVNEKFHPENVFSIKMALIIDSNSILRNLFLLFKKIYAKPVLK